MRIAFDYQAFVLQSYGGISRYFVALAKNLSRSNESIRIFAPLHRNTYLRAVDSTLCSGTFISGYPPKTWRAFEAYNKLLTNFKLRKWVPDILHETYYTSNLGVYKKCPKVLTVYDMIHERYRKDMPFYDRTTALKGVSIRRADHIICISESTKRDLINIHEVPEDKVTVIHLGFDKLSLGQQDKSNSNIPQGPYLLYVGLRAGYKNFNSLLRAFSSSLRLKLNFNIIAFGGGAFSLSENQLINSLGLSHKQVFQISGDDSCLARMYSSATALVYPSLCEGFGIPPLEAMAQDCPVVCSNSSSIPEVVGSAAEFFDPIDIEDISQAIERVVYAEDRRRDLILLGQARLRNFSWEKCADETLNVYRTLVQ